MSSKSKFILNIILLFSICKAQELYIGCYETFSVTVTIWSTIRSVSHCLTECRSQASLFAAIKGGSTCHCGHLETDTRVPSSNCNLPCGDNYGICGGNNVFAVYTAIPAYQGCFRDSVHDRDLINLVFNDQKMTIDKCYDICSSHNYKFSGVQFARECFCGQQYGRHGQISDSECDMPCTGDANQMCGGSEKNSIYLNGHVPSLNKPYAQVFHCLNGKIDMRGTCSSRKCQPGWKGTKCNQRDSAVNNGNCGQHKCQEFRIGNQIISECVCKEGFQSISVYDECKDIDECTLNVCNIKTSTCDNTIGSYNCVCKEGYAKHPLNQFLCEEIDECQNNPCNEPSETCINTIGSFMCICSSGYNYTLQNDCSVEICHGHLYKCENVFNCKKMKDHMCFNYESNKQRKEDIDECQSNPCNEPSETCINTIGSFMCICSSGYNYTLQNGCSAELCHGHLYKCENVFNCNKMKDHMCLDFEFKKQPKIDTFSPLHGKVEVWATCLSLLICALGISISATLIYKYKNRKLVKMVMEQKIIPTAHAKSESTYQKLDFSKKSFDDHIYSNDIKT